MQPPSFFSTLFLLCPILTAPTAQAQGVLTQSGAASTETLSISWTIGDNFVKRVSSDALLISEGSLQPRVTESESGPMNEEWSTDRISVYPNPARTEFFVEVEDADITQLMGTVLNAEGKTIKTFAISTAQRQVISMQDAPPGTYLLKLSKFDSQINHTYQIIKTH